MCPERPLSPHAVPGRAFGGDLRALNKHLRTYWFRMLTHASLLCLVRRNDWFTSIDLKDVYFHMLIYPPDRKYLRFAFQEVEYCVLHFDLSLSPRVFVRCTEAEVAPAETLRNNFSICRVRMHPWV